MWTDEWVGAAPDGEAASLALPVRVVRASSSEHGVALGLEFLPGATGAVEELLHRLGAAVPAPSDAAS